MKHGIASGKLNGERVWCLGCFEVRDLDEDRRCAECGAQVKSVDWWLRPVNALVS